MQLFGSNHHCGRSVLQVVCAGSLDTFQIFVWSVKTGRLLDILAAHEGPVVALAFSPTQALLASVSWDRTLRTWDVFSGKGEICWLVSCKHGGTMAHVARDLCQPHLLPLPAHMLCTGLTGAC